MIYRSSQCIHILLFIKGFFKNFILKKDHTTYLKFLKALGMIQNQGYWVLYELKPRDVEWHLIMCKQLLQQQKRKGFFGVFCATYHDQ